MSAYYMVEVVRFVRETKMVKVEVNEKLKEIYENRHALIGKVNEEDWTKDLEYEVKPEEILVKDRISEVNFDDTDSIETISLV